MEFDKNGFVQVVYGDFLKTNGFDARAKIVGCVDTLKDGDLVVWVACRKKWFTEAAMAKEFGDAYTPQTAVVEKRHSGGGVVKAYSGQGQKHNYYPSIPAPHILVLSPMHKAVVNSNVGKKVRFAMDGAQVREGWVLGGYYYSLLPGFLVYKVGDSPDAPDDSSVWTGVPADRIIFE